MHVLQEQNTRPLDSLDLLVGLDLMEAEDVHLSMLFAKEPVEPRHLVFQALFRSESFCQQAPPKQRNPGPGTAANAQFCLQPVLFVAIVHELGAEARGRGCCLGVPCPGRAGTRWV